MRATAATTAAITPPAIVHLLLKFLWFILIATLSRIVFECEKMQDDPKIKDDVNVFVASRRFEGVKIWDFVNGLELVKQFDLVKRLDEVKWSVSLKLFDAVNECDDLNVWVFVN